VSFLYVDEDIVKAEYPSEYDILQNMKKINENTTVSDEDNNGEVIIKPSQEELLAAFNAMRKG